MTEIWKDVPGFEGLYSVSDLGGVFSHRSARVLKPGRMASGHLSVVLGRAAGSQCVHALVALAFIGPRPPGLDVRHLNGVPGDNRATNLAYGTRAQNVCDKKWHGKPHKYPVAVIREVKKGLSEGKLHREIAVACGVSKSLVGAVKSGRLHYDV